MRKQIIHFIPVVISFIWLIEEWETFNPITLKGPDFLKFYAILILGFYVSIFILKLLKENLSRTTFYWMLSIFALGIVKLIRGVTLGNPIGFLMMILIVECIVALAFMSFYFKNKVKV